MTITQYFRLFSQATAITVLVAAVTCLPSVSTPAGTDLGQPTPGPVGQSHDMDGAAASSPLLEVTGPKESMGAWSLLPLAPLKDRMQSIHTTLMPNGKVLMVSGSSYRLTVVNGQPVEGIIETDYDSVNNSQIFDPETKSYRRIASPPANVGGAPNDLFCSGHIPTPDGNILFVGGQSKNENGKFYGGEFANLFDWKNEKWEKSVRLKEGHWYPSVVALGSGLIAAFSGFRADDPPTNSSVVELYDSRKPFDKAWTSKDIRDLPNSPFTTKTTSSTASSDWDQMDHYPRIFALRDGRLFITGDGSGGGNIDGRKTYFMTISPASGDGQPPSVAFSLGPARLVPRRIYGTGFIDPNSENGDIILTGGMLGSAGLINGPAAPFPGPNPDTVTAGMERFIPPSDSRKDNGMWEVHRHFLGDRPEDVRTMHIATILPNKQVLISGGGNYGQHSPTFTPILYTYDPSKPSRYTAKRMNQASQPRLYHSVALLLPDGSVLVSGGNASRAARDPKDGSVHLNVYRHTKAGETTTYSWVEPGTYAIPGEIYQAEIFYPPYLFASKPRPKITVTDKDLKYGAEITIRAENTTAGASVVLMKLGAVTHGWDYGQHLEDLKFAQDLQTGVVRIKLPTNRNTNPPGYYMLFYVNDQGKPSVSEIIKLR